MRTPSCSTTRSTLRVETPLTYASWTTATSACSARRRGSRKLGKYPGPERSFGIASSIAPTRVSHTRSRYPFRCALRRSGARSPNSAPIIAETSASINASTMKRTDSRITSACSEPINLSTACAAVILPSSAIVVLLLRQSLGGDRRFETPGGRTFLRPTPKALLHHFYRLDRTNHGFQPVLAHTRTSRKPSKTLVAHANEAAVRSPQIPLVLCEFGRWRRLVSHSGLARS